MDGAHSDRNYVKIFLDLDADPDYCQNHKVSSMAHVPAFHQIL